MASKTESGEAKRRRDNERYNERIKEIMSAVTLPNDEKKRKRVLKKMGKFIDENPTVISNPPTTGLLTTVPDDRQFTQLVKKELKEIDKEEKMKKKILAKMKKLAGKGKRGKGGKKKRSKTPPRIKKVDPLKKAKEKAKEKAKAEKKRITDAKKRKEAADKAAKKKKECDKKLQKMKEIVEERLETIKNTSNKTVLTSKKVIKPIKLTEAKLEKDKTDCNDNRFGLLKTQLETAYDNKRNTLEEEERKARELEKKRKKELEKLSTSKARKAAVRKNNCEDLLKNDKQQVEGLIKEINDLEQRDNKLSKKVKKKEKNLLKDGRQCSGVRGAGKGKFVGLKERLEDAYNKKMKDLDKKEKEKEEDAKAAKKKKEAADKAAKKAKKEAAEAAKKAKKEAAKAAKQKDMEEMAKLVNNPRVSYIRTTFSGGEDGNNKENALEQLIKHGEAFKGGREINEMNIIIAAVRVMNAADGKTKNDFGLNKNDIGLFLYGYSGTVSWYGGATGTHKKKGQYEDGDTMRNILLRIIDPSAKEKENKEKEQEEHFSALQKDYNIIIKEINNFENNIDQDENDSELDRWRELLDNIKDYMEDFQKKNIDIKEYYGKNAKKAEELINELEKEQAKQEEAFLDEQTRIFKLNEEKKESELRTKTLKDLRDTGKLINETYTEKDFKALNNKQMKSILKQYHEQNNMLEDLHLMSTTMLRTKIVGKVPLSIVPEKNPDLGTTSKKLSGKDAVNFIRNYDLLQELATPYASEEVPEWFSMGWDKKKEQLDATLFYKTKNNKILFLVIACLGADARLIPLNKGGKKQNNIKQENSMELVEIHNLSGKKGQKKEGMGSYLVEILKQYKKENSEYVFVAPSEDLDLLERLNKERGRKGKITEEGLKDVYRAWGMELILYEKDTEFDGKGYSHLSKKAFNDKDVFMMGQIDTVINKLSDGYVYSGADVDTLGYDASTNDITIRQFVNGVMKWNELRSYAKNLGLKPGKNAKKPDVIALIADYLIKEKATSETKAKIFSNYGVEPPKKSDKPIDPDVATVMEEEKRFLSGKMTKKDAIDYAKRRGIVIKGNKKGDQTAKNYAEKLREKIAEERGVNVDTITTKDNKYDLYDLTSIWDDQEDLMVPPPSSFGLADRKAREFMVFE